MVTFSLRIRSVLSKQACELLIDPCGSYGKRPDFAANSVSHFRLFSDTGYCHDKTTRTAKSDSPIKRVWTFIWIMLLSRRHESCKSFAMVLFCPLPGKFVIGSLFVPSYLLHGYSGLEICLLDRQGISARSIIRT